MSTKNLDRQIAAMPKGLRRWLATHRERIAEVSKGGGYAESDTGSDFAYDISLAAGWRDGEDFVHSIIEPTEKRALTKLRATVRCTCAECST